MSIPDIYMVLGHGGVGKTTTAAALATASALRGQRTVVMTIDPARRLADAMGIQSLGNQITPVALPDTDNLFGLMLDPKATWDETVKRESSNPEAAQELLNNRYYRALSTRLTGSHEYMASERLYQLVTSKRFDVIIVDTPPAQHALEFLKAPARIHSLLSRSMLQKLTSPGIGFASAATLGVRKTIGRILGKSVLADIAEFFRLIGTVSVGLRQHAEDVETWLKGDQTRFIWVTTPEPSAIDATFTSLGALQDMGYPLHHIFLNRVTTHTGAPFPPLPCPKDTPEVRWHTLQQGLRSAWDLTQTKALRDQAAIIRFREQRSEPVTRLGTVPHTDDPLEIIRTIADQIPEVFMD